MINKQQHYEEKRTMRDECLNIMTYIQNILFQNSY